MHIIFIFVNQKDTFIMNVAKKVTKKWSKKTTTTKNKTKNKKQKNETEDKNLITSVFIVTIILIS